MKTEKVALWSKILNIILIVVSLAMFTLMKATNTANPAEMTLTGYNMMVAGLWVWRAVSLVCLIVAIILQATKAEKVKGTGLLIASAAVSLLFAVFGFMLGIIIWILSGMSMTQMSKSLKAGEFENRLNNSDMQGGM